MEPLHNHKNAEFGKDIRTIFRYSWWQGWGGDMVKGKIIVFIKCYMAV